MAKGLSYALNRMSLDDVGMLQRMQYVWRGAVMVLLEKLNKTTVYSVKFGQQSFKFRFLPLGAGQGSRGLFYMRDRYESLLQYGHRLLEEGAVVLDIGANQGIYTCAFGVAVGQSGRVVAVEPIPRQVGWIKDNVSLNGLSNCDVHELAVSDKVGVARLNLGASEVAASLVDWNEGGRSIDVKTSTVDTLCQGQGRVDFIKLDIEGAELIALDGATETLRRFKPTLCCESFDADPAERGKLSAKLGQFGYRSFVMEEAGLKEVPGDTKSLCLFFIHEDRLTDLGRGLRIETQISKVPSA